MAYDSCLSNTDSDYGIQWPSTIVNQTAVQACTEGNEISIQHNLQ